MSGRQESAKSVHSSNSHKPGRQAVRGAEAASYFKSSSSSMVFMRVCIKVNICSSLPDLACMENCVCSQVLHWLIYPTVYKTYLEKKKVTTLHMYNFILK